MNKRDIIIVAVLLNTGLLSMLAMMAIHTGESFEESHESSMIAYEKPKETVSKETTFIAQNTSVAADEWDNVLKDYVLSARTETALAEEDEFEKEAESPKKVVKESVPVKKATPVAEKPVVLSATKPQPAAPILEKSAASKTGKTIEITVKKGDALEKIARSNGTTAEQIRALNNLKSDRLAIGQQLLIPVDNKITLKQPVQPIPSLSSSLPSHEEEYYVLKSGDNPWKIAKQFKVKFEDLLKMNNLDEEKARNLKIGDRIRVK
ncbi:MAG TPA: LysM peptidoglycan-binding domain-containing protein [Parachlamydiaceae bacterium]|nr:LysM peptidoglycan-binding domain-containing protein [Parachlamydiaceae bacterium]